ncbi:MAG: hypothetical protein D6689_14620 [Deltaproteobacteria bacterium]|nr:MAG: hypothetical protein D6689_14620 [Deltaproteobacteria bacterium]
MGTVGRRAARWAAVAPAAVRCGPRIGDGGDGLRDAGTRADAGFSRADAAPQPADAAVFAHSATELYRVDPDTLAVTLVGPFPWPAGADRMTDIAIDKDGRLIGISFDKVYAVDEATAACRYLADLDGQFNGLSFIPAQQVGPTGDETLVGAALDGSFVRIDPITGASTPIGRWEAVAYRRASEVARCEARFGAHP